MNLHHSLNGTYSVTFDSDGTFITVGLYYRNEGLPRKTARYGREEAKAVGSRVAETGCWDELQISADQADVRRIGARLVQYATSEG